MSLYESVFIARQDVSAQQVESMADAFAQVIETGGGKIAKREHWGLKNLTYKIKKNRKGHFVMFNIDAPAEAIVEYERQMRLHEDVLRYLTLKMDELEEGPSIQMQGRDRREREDGDRDRDRDRDRGRGRDDDRPPREERPARAEAAKAEPAEEPTPEKEGEPEAEKEGEDA